MIDFLKKYGLPIGLKKSVKKYRKNGRSISYTEARSILLFFTTEGNQKIVLIKALQNKIQNDGKEVKCLFLLVNEEDKPDVHLDAGMEGLKTDDFSFFGNINKSSVNTLLSEEFDFVIHADLESSIYTDLVMSKCNAKCRIGKYFHDHEQIYDMMVGIPEDKKINFLLDQIYHYTKAL